MNLHPARLALVATLLITASCSTSPTPEDPEQATAQTYKDGSSSMKRIRFSGIDWLVKESSGYVGPGPNIFSSSRDNVFVDEEGHLHLRITREVDQWHCAEVVSEQPVGYGTYRFRTCSHVDRLDPNIVLGFFTWDDVNYETMANCEIDIEWSRWTEPGAPNLHYSVQPAWGPDEPSGRYPERTHAETVALPDAGCLDVFTWRPEGVAFATYRGGRETRDALIAAWAFDDSNPPRRTAAEGIVTEPILVPVPGPHTHARINLWLVDADRDGTPEPPQDGKNAEVIIESVEITPWGHP